MVFRHKGGGGCGRFEPAYIRVNQPSLDLFEDLPLHGETLMLGTGYREEKFCLIFKIVENHQISRMQPHRLRQIFFQIHKCNKFLSCLV